MSILKKVLRPVSFPVLSEGVRIEKELSMNYAPSNEWVETLKAALKLKVPYHQVKGIVTRYGGGIMQAGGRPLYFAPDLDRIRDALDAHREAVELRERVIEELQAEAAARTMAKAEAEASK